MPTQIYQDDKVFMDTLNKNPEYLNAFNSFSDEDKAKAYSSFSIDTGANDEAFQNALQSNSDYLNAYNSYDPQTKAKAYGSWKSASSGNTIEERNKRDIELTGKPQFPVSAEDVVNDTNSSISSVTANDFIVNDASDIFQGMETEYDVFASKGLKLDEKTKALVDMHKNAINKAQEVKASGLSKLEKERIDSEISTRRVHVKMMLVAKQYAGLLAQEQNNLEKLGVPKFLQAPNRHMAITGVLHDLFGKQKYLRGFYGLANTLAASQMVNNVPSMRAVTGLNIFKEGVMELGSTPESAANNTAASYAESLGNYYSTNPNDFLGDQFVEGDGFDVDSLNRRRADVKIARMQESFERELLMVFYNASPSLLSKDTIKAYNLDNGLSSDAMYAVNDVTDAMIAKIIGD